VAKEYKKRYRKPPAQPGLLIYQLTLTTCRYIIDTPKHKDVFYCGERTSRGSYCPAHANLCYRTELRPEENI
jgi:hypothetical protein